MNATQIVKTQVGEVTFLLPNFDGIPDALKHQKFAMWKAEPELDKNGEQKLKPNGKPRIKKAPRSATGYNISKNEPEKWLTYDLAVAAFDPDNFTGVGVLMQASSGLVGIDLDDIAELPITYPEVKDIVNKAREEGIYCEPSPSNTGLRIFVYGKLPNDDGKRRGGIELYSNVSFLTVTGSPVRSGEIKEAQWLVDQLLNLIGARDEGTASQAHPANITLGNADSVQVDALAAWAAHHCAQLWEGRWDNIKYSIIDKVYPSQSEADMALAGHLAREALKLGIAQDDILATVFETFKKSGLYRPDKQAQIVKYTIPKAINAALEKIAGQSGLISTAGNGTPPSEFAAAQFDDPDRWKPTYVEGGMPARQFIGPSLDGRNRLFPAAALSSFVALGGMGKTTTLLGICCHTAAGKSWNNYPLRQCKVAMLSVEETQDELDRKFSAVVDIWTPEERQAAINNLRLVSCLGVDARLTASQYGQMAGTGFAEYIVKLARNFGLQDGLIVLDHMQGFASGDLNTSETATAIAREANKIVKATGAAVVMAAHISKANIKAETLEQGFAVGSLAFENAARQLSGMIRMSEEQAKKYGLEDAKDQYRWLGLPKNSYGEIDAGVWLKVVQSPKYHTVITVPAQLALPVKSVGKTASDSLRDRLIQYIREHPYTTSNHLDEQAGKNGLFKASKEKVRHAKKGLLDDGILTLHTVGAEEREAKSVTKQVKQVYRVVTC